MLRCTKGLKAHAFADPNPPQWRKNLHLTVHVDTEAHMALMNTDSWISGVLPVDGASRAFMSAGGSNGLIP